MASVFLIGLEQAIAAQISRALAVERHRIEQKPQDIGVPDMMDADIVFAGGEPRNTCPCCAGCGKSGPLCLLWLSHAFPKPLRGWTRSKPAPPTIVPRLLKPGRFTG